jgi:hypothetical protein
MSTGQLTFSSSVRGDRLEQVADDTLPDSVASMRLEATGWRTAEAMRRAETIAPCREAVSRWSPVDEQTIPELDRLSP